MLVQEGYLQSMLEANRPSCYKGTLCFNKGIQTDIHLLKACIFELIQLLEEQGSVSGHCNGLYLREALNVLHDINDVSSNQWLKTINFKNYFPSCESNLLYSYRGEDL